MTACSAPRSAPSPTVGATLPTDVDTCARVAPAWFCANLAQLPQVRVAISQPAGEVATLTATWRLAGDVGECTHQWPARVSQGRLVEVAATGDGLPPLWALESVTVERVGPGSMMRAKAARGQVSTTTMAAAQRDLATASLTPLSPQGTGLVVEQPSSPSIMARMTGQPADGVAATAWPWGRDGRRACTHVIVHPDFRPATEAVARYLLVHEGVHAVTRAAGWQGPRWVREGLAEFVAIAQVGDVTGARPAAEQRATHARALPSDDALSPSAAQVATAYADAALVVARMRARFGWDATLTALAERGAGQPSTLSDAEILAAYRGR